MKSSAITRIVLFSIAIVLLLGLLLVGLGIGMFTASPIYKEIISKQDTIIDGNAVSSGSVPADSVRNLDIEWVSGSITIQPGDTDTIAFSEPENIPEDQKLVWKQSGDTLKIQFCKSQIHFGFSFGSAFTYSKDLVVTVPRDWNCQELDISSVSAEITATGLEAQEIDLENVSGRCVFEDCHANNVSLETVSGNITFNGTLDELGCSAVSARCTLVLSNVPRNIQLDGVSGDLDITLPEDAGFTASLDSASGSISTDFPTTVTRGTHTCGDGSCHINAGTVSGDIIIRKNTT